MDCKFVVGQKVVCVHEGPWCHYLLGESGGPARDEVCEIVGIRADWDAVYLDLRSYDENVYHYRYFRPSTDISIFTAILDKANQRQTERV